MDDYTETTHTPEPRPNIPDDAYPPEVMAEYGDWCEGEILAEQSGDSY